MRTWARGDTTEFRIDSLTSLFKRFVLVDDVCPCSRRLSWLLLVVSFESRVYVLFIGIVNNLFPAILNCDKMMRVQFRRTAWRFLPQMQHDPRATSFPKAEEVLEVPITNHKLNGSWRLPELDIIYECRGAKSIRHIWKLPIFSCTGVLIVASDDIECASTLAEDTSGMLVDATACCWEPSSFTSIEVSSDALCITSDNSSESRRTFPLSFW